MKSAEADTAWQLQVTSCPGEELMKRVNARRPACMLCDAMTSAAEIASVTTRVSVP